ncbi:MAG: hypothetical protein ACO3ZZ_08870, partial [Solirubrobacterales bacterium]
MPSRPKGDESVNAGHPTSTRIVIAWVAVVGWAVVAAWLLGRGLAPDLSPVAPVESVLGGERLAQARDFRGSIRLVGLLSQIAVLLALAAMALYRGFPPAGTIERLKAWPVVGGIVLGALVALVLFLVRLPFAFAGWQVGTDYGLLTLGLGTWLLDGLKGLLISIVLFGLAGGAATWARARFERRFWLVASPGLGVFAVVWV